MAWKHTWRFPFASLDAKKIESAFRRMTESLDGIRAVKLHGSKLPESLDVTVEFDDGAKGSLRFAADEDLGASLAVREEDADNGALGETIAEVAVSVASELGGEEERA